MKPISTVLGALLLALTACAGVDTRAAASAEPADVQARIDRVERGLSTPVTVKGVPPVSWSLRERMAFHQVPAVSIALVNHGKVEWVRAYGVLEAATARPASPATLFQAGSVSKAVTAMGALHLVEQHALSLDAPANDALRAWKIPDNTFTRTTPVTLRQLLNHSAGMTVHGFHGYAPGQAIPSLLQVLDGAPPANSDPIRVDVTPGTLWRYSGGGFSVVQLMMTEAGKAPFDPLMQRTVLGPLGMRDSTYALSLPPAWQDRAATGHRSDGSALPRHWQIYPESAAAGLWSTAADLARIVIEVQQAQGGQSGKVLSSAMTATLLTRGLGEYGLGFYVEPLGAGTSFSHSGGTDGFRAQLYGYSHTGQGVVVLTNSDNGAALIAELLGSISAEYGWPEFGRIEKTALAPDVALNAAAAGAYMLEDHPAAIIAEGDRLYFQSDLFGAQRMELFAESRTRFFMTAQDMSVVFKRGEDGRVAGFDLLRGANTYVGTRHRP